MISIAITDNGHPRGADVILMLDFVTTGPLPLTSLPADDQFTGP